MRAQSNPRENPSRSAGSLLGVYGKSRSFLFVWGFLATLFGAVGAFVLSLIPKIGTTLHFSGNVSVLYVVGFGSIALGVVIALAAWRLAASQPTFHLHENAIRVVDRHGDRTDFYQDIEDLYTFFYGGIAYRASQHSPWTFIGSRIHRFAELSQGLRDLHVEKRGSHLYQELMAGKTALFHCLPDDIALSKSFFASRNMDHPTFDIALTAGQLKVKDKLIDIQRIGDITTNAWIERSQILDSDGRVFHAMHPMAVMSSDVLHVLIGRLQESAPKAPWATRSMNSTT